MSITRRDACKGLLLTLGATQMPLSLFAQTKEFPVYEIVTNGIIKCCDGKDYHKEGFEDVGNCILYRDYVLANSISVSRKYFPSLTIGRPPTKIPEGSLEITSRKIKTDFSDKNLSAPLILDVNAGIAIFRENFDQQDREFYYFKENDLEEAKSTEKVSILNFKGKTFYGTNVDMGGPFFATRIQIESPNDWFSFMESNQTYGQYKIAGSPIFNSADKLIGIIAGLRLGNGGAIYTAGIKIQEYLKKIDRMS